MHTLLLATATTACLLAAGTTSAADRILAMQTNGAGFCQAALPAYEGLIRKRPLAIQNQGSVAAFVTCSPMSMQSMWTPEIHGHGLHFVNYGAASTLMACSAVIGSRDGIADHMITKAVQIPAGGRAAIYWGDGEFPAQNEDGFNTTCALPPGVALTTVMVHQLLNVGE